jgi:7-cyano-7-deazaguanine synthase
MTNPSRAPADAAAVTCAVLCSAGLDSAVLLARLARQDGPVLPIYVRAGLAWESAEQEMLRQLLTSPAFAAGVQPPVSLTVDMRDVYPSTHWAITGTPPDYDTPDEEVYIVGRNVVLLSKAAIVCAYRKVPRLAIGPLAGNPFPDATPEFFTAMERALSLGLAHGLAIEAPFATMEKADVIRLGMTLGVDLALTLSCMNPQDGLHCGRCSKCRERRDAFERAGVADPTTYASEWPGVPGERR